MHSSLGGPSQAFQHFRLREVVELRRPTEPSLLFRSCRVALQELLDVADLQPMSDA